MLISISFHPIDNRVEMFCFPANSHFYLVNCVLQYLSHGFQIILVQFVKGGKLYENETETFINYYRLELDPKRIVEIVKIAFKYVYISFGSVNDFVK